MPRSDAPPEALSTDKVAQLLAAVKRRPQLADVPWHDDEAVFDGRAPARKRGEDEASGVGVAIQADTRALDAVRRRIRDRYISVRFAGVARGGADLENPTRVVKAACLALEEHQPDAALELLRLAIEQSPADTRLRLAELDIAYRVRDVPEFVAAATEFRTIFAVNREWREIARLGRRIAPQEPLFEAIDAGSLRDESEADTPQWAEPPWDGGAALDAADFHRAMTQEDARGH